MSGKYPLRRQHSPQLLDRSGRTRQTSLIRPLFASAPSDLNSRSWAGLTHEITIVLGRGRQGAYAEDRSVRVLAVDIPSIYLLPRRDECTRVYTTVYPRVYNCIHACTQVRSKYLLCRARLHVCFLGVIRRIFSDGLRLPEI